MIGNTPAPGRQLAVTNGLVATCNVCRLGYEMTAMVNNQIVNGISWADIYRQTSELYENNVIKFKPSISSIRNHGNKHIGHRSAAIRKIVEKRALQAGMDIEEGSEHLLTDFAVLETMRNKAFERLTSGKMDNALGPKELIETVKQLHQMTKDIDGSTDVAALQLQLNLILRAVQLVVPQQMYSQIFDMIKKLQAGEEDIEDAYIVEEVDN